MIIGKMDRYITLKAPTETSSSDTAAISTTYPTSTYSVWAKRVQKQSTEHAEGAQWVLLDSYEYTVRYYDAENLTTKYTLVDDSVSYEITGLKLLDNPRKDGWLITAQKIDNV